METHDDGDHLSRGPAIFGRRPRVGLVLGAALALVVAIGPGTLPAARAGTLEPMKCGAAMGMTAPRRDQGYRRSVRDYQVPDLVLRDQRGRRLRLRELLDVGRPVMLNFIFTSCTAICPVMSATFAATAKRLAARHERVRMLSISIDPQYDTPGRLRKYAARYGAGPDWFFLTGSRRDSIRVQRAFAAFRGNKMSHDYITYIRPARGRSWIRLDGYIGAHDLVAELERARSLARR